MIVAFIMTVLPVWVLTDIVLKRETFFEGPAVTPQFHPKIIDHFSLALNNQLYHQPLQ
jgi:hypothetical protein